MTRVVRVSVGGVPKERRHSFNTRMSGIIMPRYKAGSFLLQ